MVRFEVWVSDKYADEFENQLAENTALNYMILEHDRETDEP